MQRYYDKSRDCLVYYGREASSEFWDKHWRTKDLRKEIVSSNNKFIVDITKKYIPKRNSRILEGGCGKAQNVYSLKINGYDAIGIDFARETIKAVNKAVPELDVRFGDVRKLDFPDDFFDGYWSIGVIEHFWDGYTQTLSEMKRVIKPGGFLFLSFPYLSPIRKMKIKLGFYEHFTGDPTPDNFYQYAFNHKKVAGDITDMRFQLIEQRPFDAIKGLKDEISILKPMLQKLYDYSGNNTLVNMSRLTMSKLLKGISSHCILLILRKR
jgi:SAM-dependent methyltransferase